MELPIFVKEVVVIASECDSYDSDVEVVSSEETVEMTDSNW